MSSQLNARDTMEFVTDLENTFQHVPLDLECKQLRLLRIVESDDTQEIECTLEHYWYDSKNKRLPPQYWALSYVWGPDTSKHQILINGQPYYIRENLFDYLMERRMQKNYNVIWIDQICINQNCTEERNHQVSIMADIYRNARGVIVWLGKKQKEADLGLRFLYEIQNTYFCDLMEFLDTPPDTEPGAGNIGKWVFLKGGPKLRQAVIESLNVLYSNPFWTRLWVVQEVLLGNIVLVQMGDSVFHIDAISELERKGFRGPGLSRPPEVALTARQNASTVYRKRDLKWMISEFSELECQDPRDKVYGLLGTVEYGYSVRVDYRKTAEDVFVDVVVAFMNMWVTESKDDKKIAQERISNLQTLHRLAGDMIPELMDKYFEILEQDRFHLRTEMVEQHWKLSNPDAQANAENS